MFVSTDVDDRTGQPVVDQAKPIPKTNIKATKIKKRCNPLCSDILELLQEFREIFVYEKVPEPTDSHVSSSHEVSLEPTFKKRENLGKHCVKTHFSERRKCEIFQRTRSKRAPYAMAEPCLVPKILVT